MNKAIGLLVGGVLAASSLALSYAAQADFEVKGPDGRRILLQGNGTWRYVDEKDKAAGPAAKKEEGDLVLRLERKESRDRSCRFAVRLTNQLPYEVRSLILYYSAYRANGVVYDTVSSGSGFGYLKPGNDQVREFEFTGLTCQDIVRVQVVGGDRCEMGELHKWVDQDEFRGKCLARVRLADTNLVRFDK